MAEEKTFTQEEVNKMVGSARLEGKEMGRKEFEGYISPEEMDKRLKESQNGIENLEQSIKDLTDEKTNLTSQISEKDELIAKYEKDSVKKRVAIASGIPFELADRLSGETEEEIQKDAERMASLFTKPAPLANPDVKEEDGVTKRFKELNPNIKL